MKRISYNHAKAVVNNYQRRLTAAEGTGKRINRTAELKACEAHLKKIEAADQKVVNDVLGMFDRRITPTRTQRRIDAFERTGTPVPTVWVDAPGATSETFAVVEIPPPAHVSFDAGGLAPAEIAAVKAAADAMANAFRLMKGATA